MAGRATHIVGGGGLVLLLYILYKKLIKKEELTLGGAVGSFCLGAIGGVFPDWLEPAINNPNHRQLFHSVALAVVVIVGKEKLYEKLELNEEMRRYFDWFLSAYGSHLILDARTPKGLPPI